MGGYYALYKSNSHHTQIDENLFRRKQALHRGQNFIMNPAIWADGVSVCQFQRLSQLTGCSPTRLLNDEPPSSKVPGVDICRDVCSNSSNRTPAKDKSGAWEHANASDSGAKCCDDLEFERIQVVSYFRKDNKKVFQDLITLRFNSNALGFGGFPTHRIASLRRSWSAILGMALPFRVAPFPRVAAKNSSREGSYTQLYKQEKENEL